MRMILMFDMPTETADERKAYRKFRKFLLSEGFIMHQFSVYSKLLLNPTASQAMLKRLKAITLKRICHTTHGNGKTIRAYGLFERGKRYKCG